MAIDFKAKLAAERAKAALDKQLAKAAKSTAPNMNPTWVKREKKEPEPPPPDITEFDIPPAERLKLTRLINRRVTLGKAMAELRVEYEGLTEAVKQVCKIYKLDKFTIDGNRASYYKTMRSTLSKELLLGHNVLPSVIAACTITKESMTLRVSAPGENDGDDE